MPLFSEEDRTWLEDISWDLEEIVEDAILFVRALVVIPFCDQHELIQVLFRGRDPLAGWAEDVLCPSERA